MSNTPSFSTFVRPTGSPVYSAKGPALVLARRPATPSIRGTRPPTPELRDATTLEISRQIAQVVALIRANEGFDLQSPRVDRHNQELARSLQELELKLADRERTVEEREYRLADRERDLAEAEVLLKHHEALLAASRRTPAARVGLSEEERFALVNLKEELDRQEILLRETREELQQRALFIEESETKLFEKVQQQQEKEIELEQREEELKRSEAPRAQTGKKPFDEFNE
jgi:hypothetical protein